MHTGSTASNQLLQLVLLTLIFWEGIFSKGFNSLIGPYIAYGERFYNCQPNNRPLPWIWNLRATHFNPYKPKELQRVTGNVKGANGTIDDHCWSKVIVDIRSNNQWKENAFVLSFKNNACRYAREYTPGVYKQILKGEDEGACIRPPGVYEVNNTPVDWSFPTVPLIPYGYYRFRVMFGKAENLYGCWVADAKAVPRTD
ncbi:uncharacterized protein LOC127750689 [Frankliniella occidentalis]|uniref:Uncharacterized protein LOC127750689 n=1 Tax=Frankliniella occidentalis TaxID=133901 RepID=A0A9C6X4I1_FRAOC|nr:uncharacterized protein LOC127750689 [Frankliniella occidentalis]